MVDLISAGTCLSFTPHEHSSVAVVLQHGMLVYCVTPPPVFSLVSQQFKVHIILGREGPFA